MANGLFKYLLDEKKGFKYQITLKVVLKKYKSNREIERRPVYFSSTTEIVINHKYSLKNAFQEILYSIDKWINEGSGWIVELSLNTLIFQLTDHYQERLMYSYLPN